MASKNEKIYYLLSFFVMLLYFRKVTATNIDCSGKPFHCVNSTHFMICVDLGAGVSKTVDDFVIQCPMITVCSENNNFECEYQLPTTTEAITKQDDDNINSEITTQMTTVNPFQKTTVVDLLNEYISTESLSTQADVRADTHTQQPRAIVEVKDVSNNTSNIVSTNDPYLSTTETYVEKKFKAASTQRNIDNKNGQLGLIKLSKDKILKKVSILPLVSKSESPFEVNVTEIITNNKNVLHNLSINGQVSNKNETFYVYADTLPYDKATERTSTDSSTLNFQYDPYVDNFNLNISTMTTLSDLITLTATKSLNNSIKFEESTSKVTRDLISNNNIVTKVYPQHLPTLKTILSEDVNSVLDGNYDNSYLRIKNQTWTPISNLTDQTTAEFKINNLLSANATETNITSQDNITPKPISGTTLMMNINNSNVSHTNLLSLAEENTNISSLKKPHSTFKPLVQSVENVIVTKKNTESKTALYSTVQDNNLVLSEYGVKIETPQEMGVTSTMSDMLYTTEGTKSEIIHTSELHSTTIEIVTKHALQDQIVTEISNPDDFQYPSIHSNRTPKDTPRTSVTQEPSLTATSSQVSYEVTKELIPEITTEPSPSHEAYKIKPTGNHVLSNTYKNIIDETTEGSFLFPSEFTTLKLIAEIKNSDMNIMQKEQEKPDISINSDNNDYVTIQRKKPLHIISPTEIDELMLEETNLTNKNITILSQKNYTTDLNKIAQRKLGNISENKIPLELVTETRDFNNIMKDESKISNQDQILKEISFTSGYTTTETYITNESDLNSKKSTLETNTPIAKTNIIFKTHSQFNEFTIIKNVDKMYPIRNETLQEKTVGNKDLYSSNTKIPNEPVSTFVHSNSAIKTTSTIVTDSLTPTSSTIENKSIIPQNLPSTTNDTDYHISSRHLADKNVSKVDTIAANSTEDYTKLDTAVHFSKIYMDTSNLSLSKNTNNEQYAMDKNMSADSEKILSSGNIDDYLFNIKPTNILQSDKQYFLANTQILNGNDTHDKITNATSENYEIEPIFMNINKQGSSQNPLLLITEKPSTFKPSAYNTDANNSVSSKYKIPEVLSKQINTTFQSKTNLNELLSVVDTTTTIDYSSSTSDFEIVSTIIPTENTISIKELTSELPQTLIKLHTRYLSNEQNNPKMIFPGESNNTINTHINNMPVNHVYSFRQNNNQTNTETSSYSKKGTPMHSTLTQDKIDRMLQTESVNKMSTFNDIESFTKLDIFVNQTSAIQNFTSDVLLNEATTISNPIEEPNLNHRSTSLLIDVESVGSTQDIEVHTRDYNAKNITQESTYFLSKDSDVLTQTLIETTTSIHNSQHYSYDNALMLTNVNNLSATDTVLVKTKNVTKINNINDPISRSEPNVVIDIPPTVQTFDSVLLFNTDKEYNNIIQYVNATNEGLQYEKLENYTQTMQPILENPVPILNNTNIYVEKSNMADVHIMNHTENTQLSLTPFFKDKVTVSNSDILTNTLPQSVARFNVVSLKPVLTKKSEASATDFSTNNPYLLPGSTVKILEDKADMVIKDTVKAEYATEIVPGSVLVSPISAPNNNIQLTATNSPFATINLQFESGSKEKNLANNNKSENKVDIVTSDSMNNKLAKETVTYSGLGSLAPKSTDKASTNMYTTLKSPTKIATSGKIFENKIDMTINNTENTQHVKDTIARFVLGSSTVTPEVQFKISTSNITIPEVKTTTTKKILGNNLENKDAVIIGDNGRADRKVVLDHVPIKLSNVTLVTKEPFSTLLPILEEKFKRESSLLLTSREVLIKPNYDRNNMHISKSMSKSVRDKADKDKFTLVIPSKPHNVSNKHEQILNQTTILINATVKELNGNKIENMSSVARTCDNSTENKVIANARHKQLLNETVTPHASGKKLKSNISNANKISFSCMNRLRGRYAYENDCRKFYVCIGKIQPVLDECPVNTVFSEIKKQCTKNLSHCTRHDQFRCIRNGRFSDMFNSNVYYICVKNKNVYVRFQFQCQGGYHLDKRYVKCVSDISTHLSSASIDNDSNRASDQSTVERRSMEKKVTVDEETNMCKKKGKFPDRNDCRKYYVCTKKSKSVFRRRTKKCDSEEVFHPEKKRCVDSDSYECN